MASPLHDLINSFTLERGLEFDQSYTLTPTRTGSNSNGTFSLSGTTPTYQSSVGPNNGGGSWNFLSGRTAVTNFRVASGASTTDLAGFSDNDFSLGFWWKLNNKVTSQYNTENEIVIFKAGVFEISYSSSTYSAPNRILYSLNGSSYATFESSNTTNIAADTWYHIAIRRVGSDWVFYLNGASVRTLSNATTITPGTFQFGSGNTTGTGTSADMTWNISNFYYGTSANLTEANIQRINDVGFDKHKKAIYAIAAPPYVLYSADDLYSSSDLIRNSGTIGAQNLNLSGSNGSAFQRVAASGAVDGYAIELMSGFAGYDANATITYGATSSISFWFKKASAPASNTSFLYLYLNSDNSISTTGQNKIGTNGYLYWAPRIGSSNVTEINSGMSICDNNWHHIVLTRNTNSHKLYVDGSLKSSTTSGGTGNIAAAGFNFGLASSFWDEFAIFDNTELTSTQVTNLYNASPYAAININYTNTTGANVTNSTLPMPVILVESNLTYTSGVLGTASADTVHPSISTDVNLDAFGVATASADIVHPTIFVEKSVNITDAGAGATASATSTDAVITTTQTIQYSASPATASALLSSNNYYGTTTQDTSYTLSIRQISATTNTDGKNGFSIGSQYTNSTLDTKTSLLIREIGGVPVLGTVIKAKFDPAHLTASSGGDVSPNNTFNIYVFTAAPADWNTFTYANLPAKELISTTRLVDDASNNQFHLDLTAAANDSRAYTYGIFIEHVGTPPYSSTIYDRTEFSGTGLDTKLLYILTSDFVNKNVNADPGNVTNSTLPMPVISTQIYVDFAAGVQTASADIVNPGLDVQDYVDYASGTLTASAESVQPAFNSTVEYTTLDLEAFGTAVQPTISATATVSYASAPLTASALLHMPQFDIGENNSADHMNASALFVNPTLVINSNKAANPMIATDAMLADPAQAVVLNALYNASRMTASASSIQPSNYKTLFDDKWYDLLYSQHSQRHGITVVNGGNGEAILKLFDDVNNGILLTSPVRAMTNNLTKSIVNDLPTETNESAGTVGVFGNFTPNTNTPAILTGYFDDYGRKAVKINNISTGYDNSEYSSFNFTFELSIKTTKSDQIIAYGTMYSYYGYSRFATSLGLSDGKLFLASSSAIGPASLLHWKQSGPDYGFIGNKRIDDGEWHHIVVQYGWDDARVQIWIDGNLDQQKIRGYRLYGLNILGFNSDVATYASEFETSAWSYDTHRFISELEIDNHRYAYIKYEPVRAEPMTASINIGNHVGKGNRARALMLYWWPTDSFQRADVSSFPYNKGSEGVETWTTELTTADFLKSGPQEYYGWDIFPVDVTGFYASEIVKPEAYGGVGITSKPFIGTGQNYNKNPEFLVSSKGGFLEPVTDTLRYLDLVNDIDLTTFDAIFFRNFPDDPIEKDRFTGNEIVDSYFGLRESELYQNFIKSLRAVVDNGMSLYITNPQLAIDLKIVDRVEVISDMDEISGFDSDPYAPTIVPSGAAALPVANAAHWADTYKNNRLRIVNTLEGFTTEPSFIKTDRAKYYNDDANEFGAADRSFERYVYRPNGLQVGDEFINSNDPHRPLGYGNYRDYLAVPFANVKAGTIIAAFGDTVKRELETITNPYRNYAACIVVKPGDSLDGRQCGGKIVVNFTENLNGSVDWGHVDLVSDYWINVAFNDGYITEAEKNAYLAAPYNIDRMFENPNSQISQAEYNKLAFWSSNGMYVVSQGSVIDSPVGSAIGDIDKIPGARTSIVQKSRKDGTSISARVSTFSQWFTFQYSFRYPRMPIKVPSLLTRGFWWLSNRQSYDGIVQRPLAVTASSTFPMPVVAAQKDRVINVGAMVASGTIVQSSGTLPTSINIVSLPMSANATITGIEKRYLASPMTASAILRTENRIITTSIDEVVLYVMHVDPILYLREEVIK